MFPCTLTLAIIKQNYFIVESTTSVPLDTFVLCLEFFIKETTYFMFSGRVFKQCKGLAMGNRLAQSLAEIRTDHALSKSLERLDAETISFIYKYVDDIVSSSEKDKVTDIMNQISNDVGMELTLTNENDEAEVDFLDCTIKRNSNGTISTKWLKKKFCSFSTLNFHSFHPWSIKRNVVLEMIKRAFFLTSLEYEQSVKEILTNILINSSYPELFITESVNVNPWNVAPQHSGDRLQYKYISCPYVEPIFSKINETMKNNKMTYKLAPTPMANNRRKLLSRLKDARNCKILKNSVFKMRCSSCPFNQIVATVGNFNINESARRHLNKSANRTREHLVENPDHVLDHNFEILKSFRNVWDSKQSEWIFHDIGSLRGSE